MGVETFTETSAFGRYGGPVETDQYNSSVFVVKLSHAPSADVTVSLNVLLVHDISQPRRTQVKQALALGIQFSIL